MDIVYERCCGLDIHKKTVVACLSTPGAGGKPTKQVRTFGTMTVDLEALAAWLRAAAVTHVAMEATGVYWQPIYNLLEDEFTLLLANARHIKAVPGRKTDVRDCEWIADLLRHGLLRGSFVPDRPQRELRQLTRYRTALVRERSSEVNRLQKTLEGANIKLAAVASNVLGVSGRQILDALVAGATDPAALAALAQGRLRDKVALLEQALVGRFGAHQRFLVAQQLAHIDDLDAVIAQVSTEIETRLRPFAAAVERLDTIPGISRRAAEILLAELGTDLESFPSAAHLASWAGLCPGNHESAGKRTSGKTRKGNPWLRTLLVEAAYAAGRTQTALGARFRRLAARKGPKRAAIAVAHAILRIVYVLLTQETSYDELGVDYFDQRDRQAAERHAVRRLESLGYTVTLEPQKPAA
jgi:transposase